MVKQAVGRQENADHNKNRGSADENMGQDQTASDFPQNPSLCVFKNLPKVVDRRDDEKQRKRVQDDSQKWKGFAHLRSKKQRLQHPQNKQANGKNAHSRFWDKSEQSRLRSKNIGRPAFIAIGRSHAKQLPYPN
jgi:hypothetical protein